MVDRARFVIGKYIHDSLNFLAKATYINVVVFQLQSDGSSTETMEGFRIQSRLQQTSNAVGFAFTFLD